MKKQLKRGFVGLAVVLILLGSKMVLSEPGSSNDPLVSLSFVETKIEQLKYYIDSRLGESSPQAKPVENSWQVVEVPEGKNLLGKDGTEIILRSGRATAIGIEKNGIINGLTDVTAGKDLGLDEIILANHLLIVPRDDGRGARALSYSFFLVKGEYEIK